LGSGKTWLVWWSDGEIEPSAGQVDRGHTGRWIDYLTEGRSPMRSSLSKSVLVASAGSVPAEGCSILGARPRIKNRAREEIEFWILEMPTFIRGANERGLARPGFQCQR